jgi:hypothetical protein
MCARCLWVYLHGYGIGDHRGRYQLYINILPGQAGGCIVE